MKDKQQDFKRRNLDIENEVWKNIGIMAAKKDKTKKEIVNEALNFYYWMDKQGYDTSIKK